MNATRILTVQKPDIVQTIEREGLVLKKKGRSYWILCPFHAEKTPSCKVCPEKQAFYCFGCGEGGDVIKFVMKLHNLSFRDALRHMGISGDKSAPPAVDHKMIQKRELLKAFKQWTESRYRELCEVYRAYHVELGQVKSESDLESAAPILDDLSLIEHELDILQNGTNEEKLFLWKNVKDCRCYDK
jgi:hypothetical protein